MPYYLILAIATMLLWGIWAIFAKLSTNYLSPEVAMLISYFTGSAATGIYVISSKSSFSMSREGVALAALGGPSLRGRSRHILHSVESGQDRACNYNQRTLLPSSRILGSAVSK